MTRESALTWRYVCLAFVLGTAGVSPAAAQECVTCWTTKCPQMRSYVKACRVRVRHQDLSCPESQIASRGHCCWTGQTWDRHEKACIGIPSRCPAGMEAQASGCEKPACNPGQQITPDTAGHCCWRGQAWGNGRCLGIPNSCPDGFMVDSGSQSCVVPECEYGAVRQDDRIHCCLPGQVWAHEMKKCVGVPQCPQDAVAVEIDSQGTLGCIAPFSAESLKTLASIVGKLDIIAASLDRESCVLEIRDQSPGNEWVTVWRQNLKSGHCDTYMYDDNDGKRDNNVVQRCARAQFFAYYDGPSASEEDRFRKRIALIIQAAEKVCRSTP